MPNLEGILIDYEWLPYFVPKIKSEDSMGVISTLQIKTGIKKGEVTYLATLVETESVQSSDYLTVVKDLLKEFTNMMPFDHQIELPQVLNPLHKPLTECRLLSWQNSENNWMNCWS